MDFNIFGSTPEYYSGLLGQEATDKLRKRATGTGIANALLALVAQPRNQGYGSALPYIGKALMAGQQAGQNVVEGGLRDFDVQQRIAEMKRKQEQQQALQGMIGGITDPNERLFAQLAPEQYVTSKLKPDDVKVVGNSLVNPKGQVLYTEPKEPSLKAPPTRDRIVNGMTVQETMIGAPTPQNPEGVWKEIGRGARFKPESPVTFDNQVLDFAAQQYMKTGVMPSLGAGSSKMRQAIVAKAAELSMGSGMSAEEGAEQMVQNKATAAGILQLQKQKTMVGAFEKNAMRNADIALRLSGEADRTGVPVFNKWLQAGQKAILGNATVSAFNAANETFVNEYAKIMSGSMGNTPVSDSARAHAHEMLSTAQDKKQYAAVVKVLKEEMKNRMIGFEEELKEAKASLSPKKNQQPNVQSNMIEVDY